MAIFNSYFDITRGVGKSLVMASTALPPASYQADAVEQRCGVAVALQPSWLVEMCGCEGSMVPPKNLGLYGRFPIDSQISGGFVGNPPDFYGESEKVWISQGPSKISRPERPLEKNHTAGTRLACH